MWGQQLNIIDQNPQFDSHLLTGLFTAFSCSAGASVLDTNLKNISLLAHVQVI